MAGKHEAGAPEKYIVAIFAFAEILHCYFIDVLAYRQTRLKDLEGKLLWKASRPHDTSSKHPLSDFLLSLLSHILISIICGIQRPLMYVCMRLNREGRKCREHLLKREAEVVPRENLFCSEKQKRC